MRTTDELIRILRGKSRAEILAVVGECADRLEEQEERLAIVTEGRMLIDATELPKQLFLLSAVAGGMTGDKVLEEVEQMIGKLKRV